MFFSSIQSPKPFDEKRKEERENRKEDKKTRINTNSNNYIYVHLHPFAVIYFLLSKMDFL